jgi:hypothetical protein
LLTAVLCASAVLGPSGLSAAGPNQSTPPPTEEIVRREEVQRLATELLATTDLDRQEELAKKILSIDAAQPLALKRLEDVQAKRSEVESRRRDEQAQAHQRAAAARTLEEARREFASALAGRGTDALHRARVLVEESLKLAPGNVAARDLGATIDAQLRDSQLKKIAIWSAGAAVLFVGAVAGWLRWRSTRRELVVVTGQQRGRAFAVETERLTIGAVPDVNDVVIEDPNRLISRQHCEITRRGRHFFITDLSTNRTLLNDRPLERNKPAPIRRGDQISLAGEVVLRFR